MKNTVIVIKADLQGPKLQVGVINPHCVVLQNGDQIAVTGWFCNKGAELVW